VVGLGGEWVKEKRGGRGQEGGKGGSGGRDYPPSPPALHHSTTGS